jgi:hypothetical protein
MNKEPEGLDSMRHYQKKSVIRNGADPVETEIGVNGPIVVGKFVDRECPTLWDHLRQVSDRAKEKART